MLSLLAGYWKPLLGLGLIGGLVLAGILASGYWYNQGASHQALVDKEAAQKAAEADETKIATAVHADDTELADLRAYRDSHPSVPVGVCPRTVRQAPAFTVLTGNPSTATTVFQPVPTADTDDTAALRGRLLSALAARADEVSAELRAVGSTR